MTSLSASSFLLQIVTPLPAANPSDFTTIGRPNLSIQSDASLKFFTSWNRADGILNSEQKFFKNSLEPSSWDAFLEGPNTFILFSSKKSFIPSTRGTSGPTITISISFFFNSSYSWLKFDISTFKFSQIWAVPALPGIHTSFLRFFDCLSL